MKPRCCMSTESYQNVRFGEVLSDSDSPITANKYGVQVRIV
jgi:hypothetical protein